MTVIDPTHEDSFRQNISQNYLIEVKDQYEEFPYPVRDPEHEKNRLINTVGDCLSKINHYCFAGSNNFNDFKVLVAGGGTGDSTIFLAEQLKNTNAQIVHLDISASSLEIAKQRAKIRGLTNISWVKESILDLQLSKFGLFDYINCTGVLHHLEDPRIGLSCLDSVLADKGAINLMVYGKYGRTGVYQVRDLMNLINNSEVDMHQKVDNTLKVISSLPESNWFKRDIDNWHTDLEVFGASGVYDLFLNFKDEGFDVTRLYQLIDSAGMHLVSFIGERHEGPSGYLPETYLQDPIILEKVKKLPIRKQHSIAEIICGTMRKHTVYLTRYPGTIADIFNLNNVPFLHYLDRSMILNLIDDHPGEKITLQSPRGSICFTPGNLTRIIFNYLDGQRTTGEIINLIQTNPNMENTSAAYIFSEFKAIYDLFNSFDWILLKASS